MTSGFLELRKELLERERSLIFLPLLLFLGGGGVGAPPKSHNLRRGWLAIIMAGGRTQKNKAHKTRFASKSSRNAHKVSGDSLSLSLSLYLKLSPLGFLLSCQFFILVRSTLLGLLKE